MTERITAIQLPRILLPWPERCLWPNVSKGAHWSKVSVPRADQRKLAYYLAREGGWRPYAGPVDDVRVTWIACPPSNVSRFDRSNLLAAMKGAEDGLADAMGIDDSLFTPTVERGDKCKDGAVIVEAQLVLAGAVPQPIQQAIARGDSDNLRPVRGQG